MKAMVFAAGIGSRLKHLTQSRPKCLMEIGDSTMLKIVVERLKAVGVTQIVVNLHHFPEMITEYVKAHRSFGIDFTFSYEASLLDTGGGLKKVRSFFDDRSGESFFVHNSDIYCEMDLSLAFSAHTESNALATLAVMARESARGLYFSPDDQLVGWTAEATPPPPSSQLLAFSGIQVVSPRIFEFMDSSKVFSIITPYLRAARAGESVSAFRVENTYWMDMGTPEDLEELRKRLS